MNTKLLTPHLKTLLLENAGSFIASKAHVVNKVVIQRTKIHKRALTLIGSSMMMGGAYQYHTMNQQRNMHILYASGS